MRRCLRCQVMHPDAAAGLCSACAGEVGVDAALDALFDAAGVTRGQAAALRLVARAMPTRQIAAALGIAHDTAYRRIIRGLDRIEHYCRVCPDCPDSGRGDDARNSVNL